MKKFLFILLISCFSISLQGCSLNKKQIIKNNNNYQKKEENKDYIKELKKKSDTDCEIYRKRVEEEIEVYKQRIIKFNSESSDQFNLIGIFKSINMNKCFYVLENIHNIDKQKNISYIINNAEKEETIDIFNNIDYNLLNEKIKELQQ